MATIARPTPGVSPAVNTAPLYGMQLRKFALKAIITLFTSVILFVYLLPLGNMMAVALSSPDQLSQTADDAVIPMLPVTFTYEGEEYNIYPDC